MRKNLKMICAGLLASVCSMLAGCAAYKATPQIMFDLGPLPATPGMSGLQPIAIAEPVVPAWLDNPEMYYHLNYANNQQLHPYANSRWSMPPIQLFAQRLKARIAQAGGEILSTAESAGNVPLSLHIEADDFTQAFDSPNQSSGQITLRASIFNGRSLLAQKSFSGQAVAPSLDAAGGARALTNAGDAVITEILQWLTEQTPKK